MYTNKQDLIQQEILVSDLNCHIRQVKEDIRATFASHVNTLLSREQWLLDQVDSIKEEMLNRFMTKKLSTVKAKASMQSCAEFLKFAKNREDEIGVEYSKEMMLALHERLQESYSENHMPDIAFVHDRSELHQTLTRYGKLETGSSGDSVDEESIVSERSWDLLDEKKENVHEMDEKESETSDGISPQKSVCCGDGCGKPFSEIEDMDLSKYQPITEVFEEEKESRKRSLKNICKANELCKSISECVCDVPCDKQQAIERAKNLDDPILSFQARFQALYSKNEVDSAGPPHREADFVESQDVFEKDPVVRAHTLMNKALKPDEEDIRTTNYTNTSITQLARRLQCVLGGSIESEDFFDPCNEVPTPRNLDRDDDIICKLHSRLQSIICKQSSLDDAPLENSGGSLKIMSGYRSFDNVVEKCRKLKDAELLKKEKEADHLGNMKSCNGNLTDLRKRLARIYAPELPTNSSEFSRPCCQDPVEDLALKLQRIIG